MSKAVLLKRSIFEINSISNKVIKKVHKESHRSEVWQLIGSGSLISYLLPFRQNSTLAQGRADGPRIKNALEPDCFDFLIKEKIK